MENLLESYFSQVGGVKYGSSGVQADLRWGARCARLFEEYSGWPIARGLARLHSASQLLAT